MDQELLDNIVLKEAEDAAEYFDGSVDDWVEKIRARIGTIRLPDTTHSHEPVETLLKKNVQAVVGALIAEHNRKKDDGERDALIQGY